MKPNVSVPMFLGSFTKDLVCQFLGNGQWKDTTNATVTFLQPGLKPNKSIRFCRFLVVNGTNVSVDHLGESPGLMVMGGDSCSDGRGFKSQHRILDGHFFT